ncbi:MAG: hypothetical protein EBW14_12515 [Oxalobacteraceae bacterium]|nr:hypothetical protein [Oxalobacteraceae bacterium]
MVNTFLLQPVRRQNLNDLQDLNIYHHSSYHVLQDFCTILEHDALLVLVQLDILTNVVVHLMLE